MLQHNISRNTTLSNEVPLLINSNKLDLRNVDISAKETSSSSFNVILEKPLERVSKIQLKKINLPEIYNINKEDIKLTLFSTSAQALDFSEETYEFPIIRNTNPIPSLKSRIEDAYNSETLPGLINLEIFTDLFDSKFCFVWNISNIPLPREVSIKFNEFSSNLGFNKRTTSFNGWISPVINQEEFIISEELGNNEFKYTEFGTLSPNPKMYTVIIPDAKYDIYTLLNVLKRNGVNGTFTDTKRLILKVDIEATINQTGFSDLFGYTDNQIITFICVPERKININERDESCLDYTELYIVKGRGQYYFNIEEGCWGIDSLIEELNTQNPQFITVTPGGTEIPGPPIFQFSYSKITKKVCIESDGTFEIYSGGLACLLGLDFVISKTFATDKFLFPRPHQLETPYITVRSRELTRIREKDTLTFVDYERNIIFVDWDLENQEIYLSRKEKIDSFDLYFTNHRNEIINFNGEPVYLYMNFIIT